MPSDDRPQTFNLFVYGVLAVPAILQRVIGRKGEELTFQDAILPAHTRHHIKGAEYPGVVDEKGTAELLGQDVGQLSDDDCNTAGTLICGLTAKDIELLDVFEDDEYSRIPKTVLTLGSPKALGDVPAKTLAKRSTVTTGTAEADVYIWTASVSLLEPAIWSLDEFVRSKGAAWIDVNNDMYAQVEAARSLGTADADGLVGKEVAGFPTFGHNMKSYWGFAPNYVNTNHGSYGSPPLAVMEAREKLSRKIDSRADIFMRREFEIQLAEVRAKTAPIVNAEVDEFVFVPNATHGVNTVATNIDWVEGDIIVVYATTYGAVTQTMKHLCDRNPGIRLEVIITKFPCYHSEIVEATEAVLAKYNKPTGNVRGGDAPPTATGLSDKERVRMVVVDGIASVPGVIYPWEDVVSLCHKYGALSLVDAAHSIGQHHVDVKKSDPDFWVTNCHKWLMSHRASAAMYVPFRNQRLIRSSFPTGHFYESERYPTVGGAPHPWKFVEQFGWNGTNDWTQFLSVGDAIDFRKSIGGEDRIIAYNHSLAVAGGKRLSERWGTRVMENDKGELTAAMVNIELPNFPIPADGPGQFKVSHFIENCLLYDYDTFVAPMIHNGTWWARFSAQVWVELSDFDYVADCLDKIKARIERGEHLTAKCECIYCSRTVVA